MQSRKVWKWIEEKTPDRWTVSIFADRPYGYWQELRCGCNTYQQPVRKGRRGIYSGDEIWTLSSGKNAGGNGVRCKKQFPIHTHKELHPDEIFELFKKEYENITEPYNVIEVHFQQKDGITTQVTSVHNGETIVTEAVGNGRLDAVSNALKKAYDLDYQLVTYQEHALEKSSSSRAIAYVGVKGSQDQMAWGAAVDPDIIRASIDALVTAINNLVK